MEDLAAEAWAAVDWMAKQMHDDGVREMGGVPAPWSQCRKVTRQYWRKEARSVLGAVVASRALRR